MGEGVFDRIRSVGLQKCNHVILFNLGAVAKVIFEQGVPYVQRFALKLCVPTLFHKGIA